MISQTCFQNLKRVPYCPFVLGDWTVTSQILQMENPTRGEWALPCFDDLKQLGITESMDEIKQMTKTRFNRIIKIKIKESALRYINEKNGQKGKEISYHSIEMAEYLRIAI